MTKSRTNGRYVQKTSVGVVLIPECRENRGMILPLPVQLVNNTGHQPKSILLEIQLICAIAEPPVPVLDPAGRPG